MDHYVNPSIDMKPNTAVLHVGTNDLKGAETASQISNNIINLAKKCAKKVERVIVSGIITRGDNLKGKAESVNNILKNLVTVAIYVT